MVAQVVTTNRTFPTVCPVTSGLIWALDAANLSSYSGSGSTWTDISGSSLNMTLNNCTFNNTTGSAEGIVFNGSTSYGTSNIGTTSITSVSVCAWAYVTLGTHGTIFKAGNNNVGYAFGIGSTDHDTSGNNVVALFSGIRWIPTGTSFGTTGWHLVTLILDSGSTPTVYLDSTSLGSFAGTAPGAPTTSWALGQCLGDPGTSRFFNGKIGAAYFFNRVISSSEVTQICQALQRRTGLLG